MTHSLSRTCLALVAGATFALSSCFSYHQGTGQVVEEIRPLDVEEGQGNRLSGE